MLSFSNRVKGLGIVNGIYWNTFKKFGAKLL